MPRGDRARRARRNRLSAYCALSPGRPAADAPTRTRRIDTIDVHGTVATASMTLRHGPDTARPVDPAAGSSAPRPRD
ncbi:nuclear transport factor 2 family protein [Streptomyces sp. NPDC001292]|uniref:nuclear transport factor 2 family protein n=1 Tax=Streptomyces sp. NPDC001292 TaxID=3364558 RepID=UPI0036A2EB1A